MTWRSPRAPTTPTRLAQSSDADLDDAWTANRLLDLWRANRSLYGADKLATAARRADLDVGRDQVARLMGILGITGNVRGKHTTVTTRRDPAGVRHPDLIGRAWDTPTRPDQWWVADFTYVWTLAGFAYVSFVTDVYSRRILGWRVSMTKTAPLNRSVTSHRAVESVAGAEAGRRVRREPSGGEAAGAGAGKGGGSEWRGGEGRTGSTGGVSSPPDRWRGR